MLNLPIQTKRAIYESLLETDFFDRLRINQDLISFIKKFKDIDQIPSTDERYDSFVGDCTQHCLNNDDWSDEELFVERLKIFGEDVDFQDFIEAVVSPDFYDKSEDQQSIVYRLNRKLKEFGFNLSIATYSDKGLPVYVVMQSRSDMENQLLPNKLPIYIDKNPDGYSNAFSAHEAPPELPAIVLAYNSSWNDFGVVSWFDVFYHYENGCCSHLGVSKVLNTEHQKKGDDYYYTSEYMDDKYTTFEGQFFSLGQTESFYRQLMRCCPDDFKSVLWALQDVGVFSILEDRYSSHNCFHSLIRENEAERMLRFAKFFVEGVKPESFCHFRYNYKPNFAEEAVDVEFDFNPKGIMPSRLFVLIGENGTGKTQLYHSLIRDLRNINKEKFYDHVPRFSKYMSVSSSCVDKFDGEMPSNTFNYIACGLGAHVGETFGMNSQKKGLGEAITTIKEHSRTIEAYEVLKDFFGEEMIDVIFKPDETAQIKLEEEHVIKHYETMSSGEKNIMLSLLQLVANIRFDSFILFDEPETHLHPNAVTALMSTILNLLDKYQSFGFIATHSPLIVREVLADSVHIITRDGNSIAIRKIGMDCFGANLTDLTEEIFHNKKTVKYFDKKIRVLVDNGFSYEEIVKMLIPDGEMPVNLNTAIKIRTLIDMREDEEN